MFDFGYFIKNIFAESLDNFVEGDHITETASFLNRNAKTARISAKDHFKSTSLYAHFMWELLKSARRDLEAHYFSYQEAMAAHHIEKIKTLITRNRFYRDCIDIKKSAESVIKYTWDGRHFITLQPHGLLAFKRGIHCDTVYVDDPFQDPENKLNPVIVNKINRIFVSQIMDMPKKGGQLHVVGTPQTTQDFFFDKNVMSRFKVLVLPAILQEEVRDENGSVVRPGIACWPEWMDYRELVQRRLERGERLFNQEYMCSPVYSENAFFSRQRLMSVVDSSLQNIRRLSTENDVVLGWDLGKKNHPSSISVFEIEKNMMVQRCQMFLDRMDYREQLEIVNQMMIDFRVSYGFFDNTNGILETELEKRNIHARLRPVIFTRKEKTDMATQFDIRVSNKKIKLLNNQRMINLILAVDNDLQALETPEGHGDAFWSIALCCRPRSGFAFGFA